MKLFPWCQVQPKKNPADLGVVPNKEELNVWPMFIYNLNQWSPEMTSFRLLTADLSDFVKNSSSLWSIDIIRVECSLNLLTPKLYLSFKVSHMAFLVRIQFVACIIASLFMELLPIFRVMSTTKEPVCDSGSCPLPIPSYPILTLHYLVPRTRQRIWAVDSWDMFPMAHLLRLNHEGKTAKDPCSGGTLIAVYVRVLINVCLGRTHCIDPLSAF